MLGRLPTCAFLVAYVLISTKAYADAGRHTIPFSGTVVDESGKPVAGVEVASLGMLKAKPVRSAADGSFRLDVPLNSYGHATLSVMARADDGKLAFVHVWDEPAGGIREKLILKAPKVCEVQVVEGRGKPIEGAEVHTSLYYSELAAGQTDARGRWSAAFPADAKQWSVYALRPKVGFDYATGERSSSPDRPAPVPDKVTLKLDGARPPLRIKTVTRDGKPIEGVNVGASYFKRNGRGTTSGTLPGTTRKTDATGSVVFDWLPADVEGGLMSFPDSDDWYSISPSYIDGIASRNEVSHTLQPRERLSGRVTTADGRPAPDVKIRLTGQAGYGGGNLFSGEAVTDDEGRYAIRAYSQHAYVLTATRGDMAAPYRAGIVVVAGKPTTGVDFVLGPGTRLKGQVVAGSDRKPAPGTYVHYRIEKGQVPDEIREKGNRNKLPVFSYESRQADKDGRFDFLIGPGEYTLQASDKVEPIQITIPAENPPAELVRDITLPKREFGPFALTVVDKKGKPVADAAVEGVYESQAGSSFPRATTDENGRVEQRRRIDPLVLGVFSRDRTLGAIQRIDADAAEAKFVLKPLAKARGRLLDPEGRPIAEYKFNYGLRVSLGPPQSSPFTYAFGNNAAIDKDGRWEMVGLVPGETYQMSAYLKGSEGHSRVVAQVTPTSAALQDLGDVTADLSPPKPYQPPTAADRTRDAFAARGEKTPEEKLSYTLIEAKREYTRPLLLFGKPKDPASVELFQLFNDQDTSEDKSRPKTPADLRWEFELASLDVSQASVKALAKRLGLPDPGNESPRLAVLGDDGKLSAVYPLELLKDGKLNPKALAAFLSPLKPPTRDAEEMVKAGLAKAREENKTLFLICSASWCGPCRLLARFLESHKAELSKHYVFVKLDISRDTDTSRVVERYQGKDASNGVPWFAILDAGGTTLATSNAKASPYEGAASTNIGFPSSKPAVAHFLGMLKSTAPGLSDEFLGKLKAELDRAR